MEEKPLLSDDDKAVQQSPRNDSPSNDLSSPENVLVLVSSTIAHSFPSDVLETEYKPLLSDSDEATQQPMRSNSPSDNLSSPENVGVIVSGMITDSLVVEVDDMEEKPLLSDDDKAVQQSPRNNPPSHELSSPENVLVLVSSTIAHSLPANAPKKEDTPPLNDVDKATNQGALSNPPSPESSCVEPVSVDPVSIESVSVEPASVDPASVDPASVESASVESVSVESSSVESASVESASVESLSVESASVDSASVESVSVESASVESVSVESVSVESVSVESASVESASAESVSVESVSVESVSVESASAESVSVESASVESVSVESTCVESTSVESVSVESLSVESVSVESTSAESTSVESVSVESVSVEPVSIESVSVGHATDHATLSHSPSPKSSSVEPPTPPVTSIVPNPSRQPRVIITKQYQRLLPVAPTTHRHRDVTWIPELILKVVLCGAVLWTVLQIAGI
jgi:hypothetical protein